MSSMFADIFVIQRSPTHMVKINCFNLQKFVCTTVRPTQLPYKELFNWDGAAEFVADYLNFVSLDPPHDLVSAVIVLTSVALVPNIVYINHYAACMIYCFAIRATKGYTLPVV